MTREDEYSAPGPTGTTRLRSNLSARPPGPRKQENWYNRQQAASPDRLTVNETDSDRWGPRDGGDVAKEARRYVAPCRGWGRRTYARMYRCTERSTSTVRKPAGAVSIRTNSPESERRVASCRLLIKPNKNQLSNQVYVLASWGK